MRRRMIDYSRGDNLRWFWRLYHWQKKAGNRFVHDGLTFLLSRCAHRHGGYIGPDTVFLDRPKLPHGLHGIFISRYAKIGKDCWIYQNVTIGESGGKAPQIGDRCLIGAGAVLVGDIKIGNDVKIGAGTVVHTDLPDGCTVVAQPARIIEKKKGSACENGACTAELLGTDDRA